MKLHFEPNLRHQSEAIDAILGAFDGVPRRAGGARVGPGGAVVVTNAAGDTNATGTSTDIAVEMETGTGKTYVLVRTGLELARSHGFRKFVVVVPTVAIREGVLKTLMVTREHFAALFPESQVRFFGYQGNIGRIAQWTRSTDVEFMVLTVDAFNKQANVLRQPNDRFGGASPLDVIAACRPVLLLDEPHRFKSALRKQALASLTPLAVVRFGATVGTHPRVVYRLSPREAHERGLVKTVEVHSPPDDLDPPAVRSSQIEATVAGHFRLQAELLPRGIKVLSLFFLARVAEYADPQGSTRRLFEHHYEALKGRFPRFAARKPEAVSAAYFAHSRSREAGAVDSKTGSSLADADAYALIMRDKERLLSLENPVGFIFSHSALREGWDNPNVFGICTLARSDSKLRKRQELGRGMRLCVDQSGRRVTEARLNVVTVYANESYASYASGLQREVESDFSEEERPVPPRRSSDARSRGGARPPAPPALTRFTQAALLDAADLKFRGCRGESGTDADPVALSRAVGHALLQQRPPLPLRPDTIEAFVRKRLDPGSAPPSVRACAAALASGVASLHDPRRAANESVDREQD